MTHLEITEMTMPEAMIGEMMMVETPRARRVATAGVGAITLGMAGDALLRAMPWGISLPLFMTAVIAIFTWVRWQTERAFMPSYAEILLSAAVLFFAATFAVRAAPGVLFANFACMGLSLVLLAHGASRERGWALRGIEVPELVRTTIQVGVNVAFGALALFLDEEGIRRLLREHNRGQHGMRSAALRGVLLSLPLVLVFGALFMQADPVYDALVTKSFDIDMGTILSHVVMAGFFAWVTAGWLHAAIGRESELAIRNSGRGITIGATEASIALGVMNALFLSFVAVQARYLFGGEALVRAVANMTYAEYARRGFFELVTVSALVLPVLLGAHYTMRREKRSHEMLFRTLSWMLLGNLALVMTSAMLRMRLYTDTFGYTMSRVYASVFMLWMAMVLGWFGLTVLRGHYRRFVFGGLVSAGAIAATMTMVNPEAMVVRANIARARAGASIDGQYLARLSEDAVPEVVNALPLMSAEDRCAVEKTFRKRYGVERDFTLDWRTFSVARDEAIESVRGSEGASWCE